LRLVLTSDGDSPPEPAADLTVGYFTHPEASPYWPCLNTLCGGDRRGQRSTIPDSAAVSTPGTSLHDRALPLEAILRETAAATSSSWSTAPRAHPLGTPIWSTSLPALRATNMIVAAIGRNVSPALSCEEPQHLLQYSELRYHNRGTLGAERNTIGVEPSPQRRLVRSLTVTI